MRTKLTIAAIKPFPIAFASYLALAVGGLGLGEEFSIPRTVFGMIFVAVSAYILLRVKKIDRSFSILMLLLAFYLMSQLFRADDVNFALRKIDGFLVAGLAVFIISRYGYSKYKMDFLQSMVWAGILILFLTILYKLSFGFWDRDVRFFLNGPIIFGWLMSLMGLISLYIFSERQRFHYIFLSSLFLTSVIWTESKGPLVAFFASVAIFLFLERRIGTLLFSGVLFVATFFLALEFGYLPERLFVISRILSNQLLDSDFGSIGSRQEMISQSIYIFYQYPLFGVGISNWAYFTSDAYLASYGIVYPHNIFAEIFSEHGVIGASILFLFLLYIFRNCNSFGRAVFMFSLISLSFTGDMAYWRFLVFFPMVFFKGVSFK